MKRTEPREAHLQSYTCRASVADLEQQFQSMTDKALGAIVAYQSNPDRIFGQYAEFVSVVRSVAFHEGRLLEAGIAAIARCNPDLAILPGDRPMPIVPAAIELLRKNEWHEIQGIRLPSEVHASKTYKPDLFVANRARHSGLIIDVKRSLGSYTESRLEELRFKMLAVAAIASSWLGERQGPVLVDIGIAIIDGSDTSSDHGKGVFKISEIGDLFEVSGADDAMTRLREIFARRVQRELDIQCQKLRDGTGYALHQESRDNDAGLAKLADFPRFTGDVLDSGKVGAELHNALPSSFPSVRVGFARPRKAPKRK